MRVIPKPRDIRLAEDSLPITSVSITCNRAPIAPEEAVRLVSEALGVKPIPGGDITVLFESLSGPSPEGYEVVVDPGQKKVFIRAGTPRACFYALETLRRLLEPGNPPRIPGCSVRDWPGFRMRGVVEGFYYDPWGWSERRLVVRFSAGVKMNTYVYAPKHDPYHRERWREPYPDSWIEEFKLLIGECKKLFVDFLFAVSPGLSVVYSSRSDEDKLLKKYGELAKLGVRNFGLFLDDIPGELIHDADKRKYGSLAQAQADFINRVYRRLREAVPGSTLMICPTVYAGVDLGPYFSELCSALNPEILVTWTGPEVCSTKITLEDAEKVSRQSRGRLVIWDNYPVNDYARDRLNLGPLRGRDPGLWKAIYGIVSNPMNEPQASLAPLATFADYLWNPEGYDADSSWRSALEELYGEGSGDVEFLARQLGMSTIWPEDPAEAELAEKPLSDTARAAEYYSRLYGLGYRLSSSARTSTLALEARGYLDKLRLYGEAGLALLEAQRSRYAEEFVEKWLRFVSLWKAAEDIREAAGDVPCFDQKAWRVVARRRFIARGFYSASLELLAKWGLPARVVLPYSTIRYHVDGCSPWKMVDGRLDTAYISGTRVRRGDEVGLDLGRVEEILEIRVVQGVPPRPYDCVWGFLEYSVDGEEWHRLAEVRSPEFGARLGGVKARYVRLVSDGLYDRPAAIRLFLVRTWRARAYTNIPSNTLADCVVDGRLDTCFRPLGPVRQGDWIIVDLGEAKRVRRITVIQDPLASARLAVACSSDGSEYETLGYAAGTLSTVTTDTKAKYVKLEVTRERGSLGIRQIIVEHA